MLVHIYVFFVRCFLKLFEAQCILYRDYHQWQIEVN